MKYLSMLFSIVAKLLHVVLINLFFFFIHLVYATRVSHN